MGCLDNPIKPVCKVELGNKAVQYLDVFHVCVMKFLSEMWVLFQEINNLSEISVIVQSSVLNEFKLDVQSGVRKKH